MRSAQTAAGIWVPNSFTTDKQRAHYGGIRKGRATHSQGYHLFAADFDQARIFHQWLFYPCYTYMEDFKSWHNKDRAMLVVHDRSTQGKIFSERLRVVFTEPEKHPDQDALLNKLTDELLETIKANEKGKTGGARATLWRAIDAAFKDFPTCYDWSFAKEIPDEKAAPESDRQVINEMGFVDEDDNWVTPPRIYDSGVHRANLG